MTKNVLMKSNEEVFKKLWEILYPGKDEKIACDPEMRRLIDRMYDVVRLPEPDVEKVWVRTREKSTGRFERKSVMNKLMRYAAVFILPVLFLGYAVYLLNRASGPTEQEVLVGKTGKAICLTLSDGSKLDLQCLDRTKTIKEREADIREDSLQGLVYEKRSGEDSVEVFHTLTIPVAADYRVRLSDGTVVYLNSETVLRYPVVFSASERKVYLDGEAYFEVAKDAGHPFKVETRGVEVEVLGTRFNVNSYPEKENVQTTLAEGSVKVTYAGRQTVLSPGMRVSCSADKMKVEEVDVKEFTSWKDGLFIFNKMSLDDIMLQMKRWYGLNICFFNEDVKQYTFTGMINKNLPAKETFKVIEKVVDVRFSLTGNDVVITKQNK